MIQGGLIYLPHFNPFMECQQLIEQPLEVVNRIVRMKGEKDLEPFLWQNAYEPNLFILV